MHPGYAELNQSYEQATNSELALEFGQTTATCGAVRHGANQAGSPGESPKPRRPVQNSQNLRLDVSPNDLEQSQIDKSANPRKMVAQVKDVRLQREDNFMNKLLGDNGTSVKSSSRLSRIHWSPPNASWLGVCPQTNCSQVMRSRSL